MFHFLFFLLFADLLQMGYLVSKVSLELLHIFVIFGPCLLCKHLEWFFLPLWHVLPDISYQLGYL